MTDDKQERKSAAVRLVEIAHDHFEVRLADDGTVFAIPLAGDPVTFPLRGGRQSLRAELARRYFESTRSVASGQALADALLVLEGTGQQRDPEPLELRVAERGGATWVDVGDQTGRAIKITPRGWSIVAEPPVMFRRTALTAPLPTPDTDGDLDELWSWLNVEQADQPLILAWLVSTLIPDMPHPIPGLFGEQGTGKSTASKVLSGLTDPSPVPIRKAPRDPDSWVTAASGSWVVALDNLSNVQDWLSDTLCRAVTGDGDVRRQLYTDGGLVVFAFRRCVIVNGIDVGAVRGDLADRLLPIDLHLIADHQRREESQFWPQWERTHPRILGGLLDLAARVKAVLPSVHLKTKPRMADFARVLAAVDQIVGTDGLTRYVDRAKTMATDSLTGDPLIESVTEMLSVNGRRFEGTSAELLSRITPEEESWRPPRDWPRNARAATASLRRQLPVMRKAGWTADELPPGHSNVVRWVLELPPRGKGHDPKKEGFQGSRPSQASQDPLSPAQTPVSDCEVGASRPSQPRVNAASHTSQREATEAADSHLSDDVFAGQSAAARHARHARHRNEPTKDDDVSSRADPIPGESSITHCTVCGNKLAPGLIGRTRTHPTCDPEGVG